MSGLTRFDEEGPVVEGMTGEEFGGKYSQLGGDFTESVCLDSSQSLSVLGIRMLFSSGP